MKYPSHTTDSKSVFINKKYIHSLIPMLLSAGSFLFLALSTPLEYRYIMLLIAYPAFCIVSYFFANNPPTGYQEADYQEIPISARECREGMFYYYKQFLFKTGRLNHFLLLFHLIIIFLMVLEFSIFSYGSLNLAPDSLNRFNTIYLGFTFLILLLFLIVAITLIIESNYRALSLFFHSIGGLGLMICFFQITHQMSIINLVRPHLMSYAGLYFEITLISLISYSLLGYHHKHTGLIQ